MPELTLRLKKRGRYYSSNRAIGIVSQQIHAYYTEGISTSEIAERLGVSQKTVQNQINTVNKALRARRHICLQL
ncbi:HTH domain-containing protein [Pedobacter africanus]|uniref:HTH domain-containing protein n=1 Tax=Pedobacter africanus TaxID=151894 RepID=UPI0013562926